MNIKTQRNRMKSRNLCKKKWAQSHSIFRKAMFPWLGAGFYTNRRAWSETAHSMVGRVRHLGRSPALGDEVQEFAKKKRTQSCFISGRLCCPGWGQDFTQWNMRNASGQARVAMEVQPPLVHWAVKFNNAAARIGPVPGSWLSVPVAVTGGCPRFLTSFLRKKLEKFNKISIQY
jgi:hypothetical protein